MNAQAGSKRAARRINTPAESKRAARQINTPAKSKGAARRINTPAESKGAARRINMPAESKGGVANECAGQKQEGHQHQIGGLAADAPANEETKSAGNAPAK